MAKIKTRQRPRPENGIEAAIDRAIELFGSEKKLAAAVGYAQQVFNRAVRRGRVSPELAIAIQKATGGHVTANELRPDLWRRAEDVPVEKRQLTPR
jgi:DNA-binding transcriptional regulator YdaS (Cro superfamily)